MTKMIAFDLFGVVFTEGHMVSGTLMPLLPLGTEKKRVNEVYHQYTNGQIKEADFWRGIGVDDSPQLREMFLNSFELDQDLNSIIKILSPRYDVSILSNLAPDWADFLIKKFEFESIFKPIVVSGKEGFGKPDKRIYEALIERSQLASKEIVFIDDRLENLATAHQLGMKTIHYQGEPDHFAFEPDHQINTLNDVLDIL